MKHGTSSQLSLQNRMHTPVLYNKRAHLPTPRTPPELPGTWTPQFVLPSMQNPRVCFLFGGNGPSCSVLGLHQMVSEALSNTLPAPPTHTHLLGRKMARWSSVQIVPLPLHSLTPPPLPPAAAVGFSPHPSNSSAPLLSFFFTFQFSHLIPRSAGSIPCLCAHHFRPLPPLSRHPPLATVLAVQPQGLCKVPLGRKKPCLKVV